MSQKYALSRASVVLPIMDMMQEFSISPKKAYQPLGLKDLNFANHEVYLPTYALGHIIDSATQLTRIPEISFMAGETKSQNDFHPLFQQTVASNNELSAILLSLSNLSHLQGSHVQFDIQYYKGELRIYFSSALSNKDRGFLDAHLFTIARLITLLRIYQGSSWKPDYLVFEPDISKCPFINKYTNTGRVIGNQNRSYIPISIDLGDDEFLLAQQIKTVPNALNQVKYLIQTFLAAEEFSLDWIAHMFGVSERTIQRMFTEAGSSYRDYWNDLRITKAKELLIAGESVTSVAHTLQYTEPANFTRAFKKATGYSPSQIIDCSTHKKVKHS